MDDSRRNVVVVASITIDTAVPNSALYPIICVLVQPTDADDFLLGGRLTTEIKVNYIAIEANAKTNNHVEQKHPRATKD